MCTIFRLAFDINLNSPSQFSLGWGPQRPTGRAVERNEPAIRQWRHTLAKGETGCACPPLALPLVRAWTSYLRCI